MRTRPVTPADAEAIFAVGLARDVADTGEPDWSLDTVRDQLAAADAGLMVEDDGGSAVAFALVRGIDVRVAVHPDACGRGIGSLLRDEVERLAHCDVLRQEVMASNTAAVALLEAAGYELEERFWRMARELDGSERAEPPAGIELRPLVRGGDDRAVYELVSDAMRGVAGNTERSFEEWTARAMGTALAPELSVVAVDERGRVAGVALCEGDGEVHYLAVGSPWRGRGLGRALLSEALARFARAGLSRGALWVNVRNEGATRLYRNAGMDVVFSADRYVKRLSQA